MSKSAHFLLFALISLFLFGLFALPGSASEKPLISNYALQPDMQLTVSGQITFTPVATIYLPSILQRQATPLPEEPPPPGPVGIARILSNYSSFTDGSSVHIVGEVENNGTVPLRFIKVSVNFFNASNQLVDTDFTHVTLKTLGAGDKACFNISAFNVPEWAYFEFETLSFNTDGNPLSEMVVFGDSGTYDAENGQYRVRGFVQNNNIGGAVESVDAVTTLYSSAGTVLDCKSEGVSSRDLNPSQASSFEEWFHSRDDYGDVASYRIQVDGDLQDSPYTPLQLQLLPNYSVFTSSLDTLWIVGEVQNNDTEPVYLVNITANFFNQMNQLVDVDHSFLALDDLSVGDKSCFRILVSSPASDWSSFEFDAITSLDSNGVLTNMTVSGDSGIYDPMNDEYKVIGFIQNNNSVQVRFVKAVITLYDSNGTVWDCDTTFTNNTDLNPGENSSFENTFTLRNGYDEVTAYKIQVDGNLQ